MIDRIYNMYASLYKLGNFSTGAGKYLHEVAVSCLGLDMGDSGYGQEVDCAVSVNNVVFKAFGDYAGGDISTYRMYNSIKNNKKFIQVTSPLIGDIVLSPTEGKKIGHVGIYGYGGFIYSNNSKTGKFDNHFSISSWKKRYTDKIGLPVYYFRRISY